jgi:hypothetical protein
MKQIELTSKLVVALIAVVAASAMVSAPVIAQTSAPPIRDNSITSAKIKDGEVKTQDLADGAIQLNAHIVQGEITDVPTEGVDADAVCPDGEILTGGGFRITGNIQLASMSTAPNTQDTLRISATSDSQGQINPFAFCMDATIP